MHPAQMTRMRCTHFLFRPRGIFPTEFFPWQGFGYNSISIQTLDSEFESGRVVDLKESSRCNLPEIFFFPKRVFTRQDKLCVDHHQCRQVGMIGQA